MKSRNKIQIKTPSLYNKKEYKVTLFLELTDIPWLG
jgi:hypothetical protein